MEHESASPPPRKEFHHKEPRIIDPYPAERRQLADLLELGLRLACERRLYPHARQQPLHAIEHPCSTRFAVRSSR
jgi:hypothetical protein